MHPHDDIEKRQHPSRKQPMGSGTPSCVRRAAGRRRSRTRRDRAPSLRGARIEPRTPPRRAAAASPPGGTALPRAGLAPPAPTRPRDRGRPRRPLGYALRIRSLTRRGLGGMVHDALLWPRRPKGHGRRPVTGIGHADGSDGPKRRRGIWGRRSWRLLPRNHATDALR